MRLAAILQKAGQAIPASYFFAVYICHAVKL
jgi:hypothetical protein